jgi:hypothetical protein
MLTFLFYSYRLFSHRHGFPLVDSSPWPLAYSKSRSLATLTLAGFSPALPYELFASRGHYISSFSNQLKKEIKTRKLFLLFLFHFPSNPPVFIFTETLQLYGDNPPYKILTIINLFNHLTFNVNESPSNVEITEVTRITLLDDEVTSDGSVTNIVKPSSDLWKVIKKSVMSYRGLLVKNLLAFPHSFKDFVEGFYSLFVENNSEMNHYQLECCTPSGFTLTNENAGLLYIIGASNVQEFLSVMYSVMPYLLSISLVFDFCVVKSSEKLTAFFLDPFWISQFQRPCLQGPANLTW